MEGCSESDPVKAILFCLQGVGTTITVAQVCHDFCSTFVVPFVFIFIVAFPVYFHPFVYVH